MAIQYVATFNMYRSSPQNEQPVLVGADSVQGYDIITLTDACNAIAIDFTKKTGVHHFAADFRIFEERD